MHPTAAMAMALLCLVAASFAQEVVDDLHSLYRTRNWFALRAAVSESSPPVIRGAVLDAFNDVTTAERLFRGIIRSQPRSDAASDAYAMLSQIFLRSGQYRRLLSNLDEWAVAFSDRPAFREARDDVEQFRGLPDQTVGPRRRSTLRHEADAFSLPVSVNGKTGDYLFDTGAWVSGISEPEAKRLGLTIRQGTGTMSDGVGSVRFRTAVAKEVTIGAMRFRDVSFAVFAHEGEFGILGIPILLGLGSINWSKDGAVEVGGAVAPLRQAAVNLVFDRNHLLLRTRVYEKEVLTTLDTGATTTELNANFATLFEDIVQRTGTKTRRETTGLGGTQAFDAVTLPEVLFTVNAASTALRPAHVILARFPAMGGDCCVGNAGHDLITQGHGFSIDFSTMTLQLH